MVVAAALLMMMAWMQPGETMRLRLPDMRVACFLKCVPVEKKQNKNHWLQQRHRTIKTCLNFCLAQKPAQTFLRRCVW
jgi:hypothetical protein